MPPLLFCSNDNLDLKIRSCVYAETEESALVITGIKGRINRAVWSPLNRTIITAGEDATIPIWDSEVRLTATAPSPPLPYHCSRNRG
jgi:WD40 repeat protein